MSKPLASPDLGLEKVVTGSPAVISGVLFRNSEVGVDKTGGYLMPKEFADGLLAAEKAWKIIDLIATLDQPARKCVLEMVKLHVKKSGKMSKKYLKTLKVK